MMGSEAISKPTQPLPGSAGAPPGAKDRDADYKSPKGSPSYPQDFRPNSSKQRATDLIDEASMESFPASDPPGYYACHV